MRLKLPMILLITLLVPAGLAFGQASKVGVVDFERAVVESAEGKAAQAKFNARLEERQKELEKKQREIEDLQKRLQTQEKVLSDAVKANLQKDIARGQTELTRLDEDVQKELETLRNELLQPIAQRANAVLNAFANEQNYTVIVDSSRRSRRVKNDKPRRLTSIASVDSSKDSPCASTP